MSENPTYKIYDWKSFLKNEIKGTVGWLKWVAMPIDFSSLGYQKTMTQPDAMALYGAWVVIVELAGTCEEKGVLASKRGGLTAEEIAIKTSTKPEEIERAFQWFSSIGWLIQDSPENPEDSSESSGIPKDSKDFEKSFGIQKDSKNFAPTGHNNTEHNNTEQDMKNVVVNDDEGTTTETGDVWESERLDQLIDDWNELPDPVVKVRERRSKEILLAWERVRREKTLREFLRDRKKLMSAIRAQPWLYSGAFFRFPWLFSQKNGTWNAQKVLNRQYADRDGKPATGRAALDAWSKMEDEIESGAVVNSVSTDPHALEGGP